MIFSEKNYENDNEIYCSEQHCFAIKTEATIAPIKNEDVRE